MRQPASARPDSALSDFLPNDVDIWKHQNKHTHTTGPRPYFDTSAHVYVHNHGNDDRGNKWRHKHIQAKANKDKLCETKQNQRYSPHLSKRNNTTSASDSSPSRSLSFSPPLESCSDIYTGPTSCLIITLLFNVLFLLIFSSFFYLPFLSICSRSANIHPVHSNWALFSVKTRPLTAGWLQVCFGTRSGTASKAFFKNRFVHV